MTTLCGFWAEKDLLDTSSSYLQPFTIDRLLAHGHPILTHCSLWPLVTRSVVERCQSIQVYYHDLRSRKMLNPVDHVTDLGDHLLKALPGWLQLEPELGNTTRLSLLPGSLRIQAGSHRGFCPINGNPFAWCPAVMLVQQAPALGWGPQLAGQVSHCQHHLSMSLICCKQHHCITPSSLAYTQMPSQGSSLELSQYLLHKALWTDYLSPLGLSTGCLLVALQHASPSAGNFHCAQQLLQTGLQLTMSFHSGILSSLQVLQNCSHVVVILLFPPQGGMIPIICSHSHNSLHLPVACPSLDFLAEHMPLSMVLQSTSLLVCFCPW